ncbi:PREDICTED: tripartite motif-containing protein 45-like [Dinoponera quadriceps]|uniref:Tripartite motif-containing protein 45-like n=1 Tax=Dinoponera quadriceps TaxID=609295 RepID=A0A6P3X3Q3_DINQU|nr:PREDICTED: tripartite motif-containing protein 45-like [Dinoponera quadriceps]
MPQSMDLANCSAKRASKSCCGRETGIGNEFGSCDHIYASLVECNSKGINNEEVAAKVEPATIVANKRNEDPRRKAALSWPPKIPARQPSPVLDHKMSGEVDEASAEVTRSPCRLSHDADFQCPRCGRRMEEPRLLPCLHPICLSCVYELMNRPSYVSLGSDTRDDYGRTYATAIGVRETCPLCDSYLPNVSSPVPPPHYPLQHRLVMDTVRRKLVNRVLCDTCAAEVPALIQCSTCLRNFCSECGRQHEQQNIAEARTTKHLMRPLWEATKVRRTILCQTHPIHALRFYCIACQQVTCKECMWSIQHRGHASEDAVGVGKRAGVYLTTMLQRARIVLNNLLTQYDYDVFSYNAFEEPQNIAKSYRYVCPILILYLIASWKL